MDDLIVIDLFCGAGGAACGIELACQDAGVDVTIIGVDNRPQPRYPYNFLLDEWDNVDLEGADFVWASPPCQRYTIANNIHKRVDHPHLIPNVRARLASSGLPYIIENVPRSPLFNPALVCGRALGIGVKRHRLFESNFSVESTKCPKGHPGNWLLVFGHTVLNRGKTLGYCKNGAFARIHRTHQGTDAGRKAMGIPWMSREELSEAVPPAYSRYIFSQWLTQRVGSPPA